MADNNDYRRLLGERLARAEMLAGDIDPPSDKEILRWKQLAQMRRHEKQHRKRALLSLAAVVALAFSINLLPAIEIPDAQADRDDVTEITDFREDEDNMKIDIYRTYDDLPDDVLEEFRILTEPPDGFVLSEIRVVTVGDKTDCESKYRSQESKTFVIRQDNYSVVPQVIVDSDYVEVWNGSQIWVKEFTNGEEATTYRFVCGDSFFNVMADRDVSKDTIKEAVASLLA